jgi:magnesium transporter
MTGAEPGAAGQDPPELSDELIRAVQGALDAADGPGAAALALPLHAADLADLLEQLQPDRRRTLVQAIGPKLDPDTFVHLAEEVRHELLEALDARSIARLAAALESDDAVALLSDLEPAEQMAILSRLPAADRTAIEEGLAFPEKSAGRLMQREVVAVPDYWAVGQAIDYLRSAALLPETFYDIILVDPRYRPVGAVPLSHMLRSPRQHLLKELEQHELRLIEPETDQEQVAFLFRQYGLVSAPVVDAGRRLLGVITVDDVVDVIEEEAQEDILRLGGVGDTGIFAPPWRTSLGRLPWLVVNLGTAILASAVILQFQGAIARLVALAVLMPIVPSMGGNAGTQTLTVAVRALAVKELTPSNALRIFTKELIVGGLNGIIFLAVGALLVLAWFHDLRLAMVFGLAMVCNLLAAGIAGVAIPLVLDRLGFDPAIASSVFVTTVTDVVGFFAFLALAVVFLL